MKNFIIEVKVNPRDDWKKLKKFKTIEKGKQSLETLKKHVSNLFKDSDYYQYRLLDTINNEYFY